MRLPSESYAISSNASSVLFHVFSAERCHFSFPSGLFADDEVTRPVVSNYVSTRHNVQPYIKYVFFATICVSAKPLSIF